MEVSYINLYTMYIRVTFFLSFYITALLYMFIPMTSNMPIIDIIEKLYGGYIANILYVLLSYVLFEYILIISYRLISINILDNNVSVHINRGTNQIVNLKLNDIRLIIYI